MLTQSHVRIIAVIECIKKNLDNIQVGTPKPGSKDLIAKASKDIHEGDQLFITYGALSNSELLRYFAFVTFFEWLTTL